MGRTGAQVPRTPPGTGGLGAGEERPRGELPKAVQAPHWCVSDRPIYLRELLLAVGKPVCYLRGAFVRLTVRQYRTYGHLENQRRKGGQVQQDDGKR